MTSVVTEEHEQRLWDELNSLMADAVPQEATEEEAERRVILAIMGLDAKAHELHLTVRKLARDHPAGYLRAKLDEDNPIARARRRLYGPRWA